MSLGTIPLAKFTGFCTVRSEPDSSEVHARHSTLNNLITECMGFQDNFSQISKFFHILQ